LDEDEKEGDRGRRKIGEEMEKGKNGDTEERPKSPGISERCRASTQAFLESENRATNNLNLWF